MFSLPQRWREDKFLWLVCALAFGLALAFNFAIIPGYGPDEPRHLAYIRLLWEERTLPRVLSNVPYSEYKGAHAFHPPLYYTLLLPFFAVAQGLGDANLTHFLRFWSGLACVLCLPLLWDVAMVATRENRAVARLALCLTALVPMFGMTSGTINNDAGAFWFSSLFLWLLLWKWREEISLRRALILGVVLGLGGLCKATALAIGFVAIAIWALVYARENHERENRERETREFGRFFSKAALVCFVGALLVAPWHGRSFALYGSWNPLPPAAPWGQLPPPAMGKLLTMAHPEFPAIFVESNFGIFRTLWSQRDWLGQVVAPPTGFPPPLQPFQLVVALAFSLLATLAVVGHLKARKTRDSTFEAANKAAFFAPLAAFGAVWLVVLNVALFMHQGWAEGGRYLFPILSGFCVFLAVGLHKLSPRAFGFWLGLGFVGPLFLSGFSLYWLLVYLNPTFGPK